MDNLYDVIVVGGGPAGLTAALYLARAKYRVLVLEKEKFGGQITITSEVVNYPGVFKTSGKELTETMRKQAEAFGAEFMIGEVQKIEADGDIKTVKTDRGDLKAFGILIATGAHPRSLGFKGEEEFKGRGVAYCATCDGEFFTGKEVFVVGGGFAAAEESVFLTRYAKHVTVLMRKDDFSCAGAVADEAKANPKITIVPNVSVEEVGGKEGLDFIVYKNNKTGEVTTYRADDGDSFGVFVFAGYEPATDLVKGIVELDERNYVITSPCKETNVKGVYAAGDVCQKNLRQIVTATADGAIAATELERLAAEMQKKTGLRPEFKGADKDAYDAAEKEGANISKADKSENGLFDADTKAQLKQLFSKFENSLELRLALDGTPLSEELKGYVTEIAKMTDKISVKEGGFEDIHKPCVRVYKNNEYTGLAFHGVPGGHEFTSFVVGLYNIAGPGQEVSPAIEAEIDKIDKKTDLKILVSLSCTMCPELVMSAQKIASCNDNVTAEVFDISHFEDLKDKYKVMSVPCMVVNDDKVTFGKKNVSQLLSFLG